MSNPVESPPTVGSVVVKDQSARMKRWAHSTTLTLEIIAATIIFIMMFVVLANVLSRYVFSQPIQGTNELVGYIALPSVVFIGYVVAQARGQSIEADIVYQKFPQQIRREVRLLTSSLATLACVGFGWYGFTEAMHANRISKTAPASDVLIAPVYWFVPVAFAVLVCLFILDAIRAIRGRFDNENFIAEELDDPAVG